MAFSGTDPPCGAGFARVEFSNLKNGESEQSSKSLGDMHSAPHSALDLMRGLG